MVDSRSYISSVSLAWSEHYPVDDNIKYTTTRRKTQQRVFKKWDGIIATAMTLRPHQDFSAGTKGVLLQECGFKIDLPDRKLHIMFLYIFYIKCF